MRRPPPPPGPGPDPGRPAPRPGYAGFRYSRWDGTQQGFDLDADALLEELRDDLVYHGDLHAALRRLLQQGMRDRTGERILGMGDLLERLAQRRREMLERYDLGGVYSDIAARLEEIVDQERDAIDRHVQRVADAGDERDLDDAARAAAARRSELDGLPPDLARRVDALRDHDWCSAEAEQAFDALLDELREQVLQSTFHQLASGMQSMSPEQMARTKDMLAGLNEMLARRERGEDPGFAAFMARFGDFFPGHPESLDDLLEQLAQSMAQMSRMLASMSPEQRAQLQALAASLLDDVDLRWQLDQLARSLEQAFPDLGWGQGMPFSGDEPLSLGQVPGLLASMGDLDDLEHLLRAASQPGELAEVDLERAAELLGDDAARSLERLAELARILEEAGLVEQREGRLELTPRGIRAIGQKALGDLFRALVADRVGRHELARDGVGHDPAYEHKPYEWGDPFRLDVQETVKRAIGRQGGGTPVRLSPSDFEVERTERLTRASTVLLLDVSLSMPMRGNFLAAKKMAMALHALVTTRFPRDFFGLVSFGRVAREVSPDRLPEMSWDFEWGTNMQHALLLARRRLARESGTRQVIMVTDGEPTAHIEHGEPYFQYPPSPVTVEETLKEVLRCTRDGIRINTFVLDETFALRSFVERMMQVNRGRAFFTTPETLGDYVLVDFLEHRRTRRAG